MEFNKLLEQRRSVRKFDGIKKLEKNDIIELVYAAQQAPSWKNSETGKYYFIISPDLIKKFREECFPKFNQERTEGVEALLVTSFEKNISGFIDQTTSANDIANGWGCYDLGLQNMNLLLAAKEKGFDTLIMGMRYDDKIRSLLHIPNNEIIVSVIAIGCCKTLPEKPERKPIESILTVY